MKVLIYLYLTCHTKISHFYIFLFFSEDENASLLKEQDKSCLQSEKHLGSASLLRTSEPQECSSSISPILNQDCLSQELFAKPDPIPQGALCPQLLHALEATHEEDLVRATFSGLELSEIKEESIPSSSESIVSLPDSTCPSLPARSDSDNGKGSFVACPSISFWDFCFDKFVYGERALLKKNVLSICGYYIVL